MEKLEKAREEAQKKTKAEIPVEQQLANTPRYEYVKQLSDAKNQKNLLCEKKCEQVCKVSCCTGFFRKWLLSCENSKGWWWKDCVTCGCPMENHYHAEMVYIEK
jgi:hypothetical protein